LALAPYVLPDKILADTPSYAPTLKYYAEKFVSELIRRVSRLRNGKIDGGQVSA